MNHFNCLIDVAERNQLCSLEKVPFFSLVHCLQRNGESQWVAIGFDCSDAEVVSITIICQEGALPTRRPITTIFTMDRVVVYGTRTINARMWSPSRNTSFEAKSAFMADNTKVSETNVATIQTEAGGANWSQYILLNVTGEDDHVTVDLGNWKIGNTIGLRQIKLRVAGKNAQSPDRKVVIDSIEFIQVY